MSADTLAFALLTSPGDGGISVFSCLGEGAAEAISTAFRGRRPVADAAAGELLYGRLVDESGEVIDEVIVAVLERGGSRTGGAGDLVEVNCHGGVVAAHEVARRLRELGFRELGGREFSAALVRSGFSDPLSEAAIRCLSRAVTLVQIEFITRASAGLRRRIREALAGPDDGLPSAIEALLEGRDAAERLAGESRVTVVGPANSGKSTLANALARRERFVTSPEPHTTRDVVETLAEVAGLAVRLADTAGALSDPDELGAEGWRRALAAAGRSDLVLLVMDGSQYPTELDRRCEAALECQGGPVLEVLGKADLGLSAEAAAAELAAVSALEGEGVGVAELAESVRTTLLGPLPSGPAFDKAVAEVLSSALSRARAGDNSRARGELAAIIGK